MRILVLLSLFIPLAVSAKVDNDRFEKDMKQKGYSIQGCILFSMGIDDYADRAVITSLRSISSIVYPKMADQKIMILEGGKYHTLDIDLDNAFEDLFESMVKCSQ